MRRSVGLEYRKQVVYEQVVVVPSARRVQVLRSGAGGLILAGEVEAGGKVAGLRQDRKHQRKILLGTHGTGDQDDRRMGRIAHHQRCQRTAGGGEAGADGPCGDGGPVDLAQPGVPAGSRIGWIGAAGPGDSRAGSGGSPGLFCPEPAGKCPAGENPANGHG